MEDLIGIALRISVIYIYVLAILRLSGKRSIDHISTLDFMVALIIGDMFDDIIWAEVPLAQGIVGLTVIMLLHTLMAVAETHFDIFHRLLNGEATQVIDHAAVQEDGLRKERTNEAELWSQLRSQGKDQLEEVREAYWETGGKMSMLPTKAAEVAQKQDLKKLKEMAQQ